MPIEATRALLHAALSGELDDVEYRVDPMFGFEVPVDVPGVDARCSTRARPGPTRRRTTARRASSRRCSATTSRASPTRPATRSPRPGRASDSPRNRRLTAFLSPLSGLRAHMSRVSFRSRPAAGRRSRHRARRRSRDRGRRLRTAGRVRSRRPHGSATRPCPLARGPHHDARAARLAQAAIAWRGGAITTSTGETVDVLVSDAFAPDRSRPRAGRSSSRSSCTGPSSRLTMYIAPLDEVRPCGERRARLLFAEPVGRVGETLPDGTTPEEVVRHEYGHHIALYRSNTPWRAIDWGPKHWASPADICARVARGEAFPGRRGRHYAQNPGRGLGRGLPADGRAQGRDHDGDAGRSSRRASIRPRPRSRRPSEDVGQPWTAGRRASSASPREGPVLVDPAVDAARRLARGDREAPAGRAAPGRAHGGRPRTVIKRGPGGRSARGRSPGRSADSVRSTFASPSWEAGPVTVAVSTPCRAGLLVSAVE